MALSGVTKSLPGSVLGTSIGNLSAVLRSIGSLRFLWSFWPMGIFLGSAKAEFSIWKFLDRWMYQSWSCMTNISNHMEGNLINKHMMNNFYPGKFPILRRVTGRNFSIVALLWHTNSMYDSVISQHNYLALFLKWSLDSTSHCNGLLCHGQYQPWNDLPTM